MTAHQIWSCHVTQDANFEFFLFCPNSKLNIWKRLKISSGKALYFRGYQPNNKKRSHTQLDSRKQVVAFQDRVITINIKEAQHPLKSEKQVIDKSSINVENFDKIHASSASVRNWSSQ